MKFFFWPWRFKALAPVTSTSLIISLALVACARPRYDTAAPPLDASPARKSDAPLSCQAHFAKSDLCVDLTWVKAPTESAAGEFVFKFFRANHGDGSPLVVDPPSGMTVAVELWMPSMSHGSSPIAVTALDTGTYRASDVFFIMRGAWEIHFELKAAPGENAAVLDQATVPLAF